MKLAQKIAVGYIRAKLNLLSLVSPQKAAAKAFKLFCTPFKRPKRKMPPVFDKAEKLQTTVEGYKVKGYRWNKGAEKRILILHGFESSCRNFDRYVMPLVKKGYEVLAFDAPAHGSSSGKQITLPLYIKTIETIYFEYGQMQSFMAHSFGGLALAHFIEKVPHSIDTKLVFIAPATESVTAIDSFFTFLQLNKQVRFHFEELLEKKAGVPASYFSIARALENIQASILWIHDEEDDVTPLKDVEPIMNKKYPNAQFMITKGWGHRKIYKENKVVKAVMEFL